MLANVLGPLLTPYTCTHVFTPPPAPFFWATDGRSSETPLPTSALMLGLLLWATSVCGMGRQERLDVGTGAECTRTHTHTHAGTYQLCVLPRCLLGSDPTAFFAAAKSSNSMFDAVFQTKNKTQSPAAARQGALDVPDNFECNPVDLLYSALQDLSGKTVCVSMHTWHGANSMLAS